MTSLDADSTCPACGGVGLLVFHEEASVPSHSCLLLDDVAEARSFPRGQLRLGMCKACGFITNTVFDPALSDYSERYEETQVFSERFRGFASDLAKRWVEGYGLHGKTVLEIGCGKGWRHLVQMVEHGAGAGIGIDPGVHPDRVQTTAPERLTWIVDLFSEKHSDINADAIVCRHTLEHIWPVADFLSLIRSTIGERLDVVVLFELPDVLRVLRENAFWDVYYEHCSYFSIGSLARLFRRCGFEVLDARLEYDDQYIVLEARPVVDSFGEAEFVSSPVRGEDDLSALVQAITGFEQGYDAMVDSWRDRLAKVAANGRRAVIWGGGSKGVAFLTALGDDAGIDYAVDINPFKHDKYIAGSGQRVVSPEFLRELSPDVVVVMNSIYRDEVRAVLDDLEIEAELWTL